VLTYKDGARCGSRRGGGRGRARGPQAELSHERRGGGRFRVTKLRGSNAVQVGRDVRVRLAEIEKQLPEGLFLAVNFDTTVFVERAINEILFTLVLAALLTSLVCWVFLGSWSTTLNVLLAIPPRSWAPSS
jgi:Cu/Ag efflux pump CusA